MIIISNEHPHHARTTKKIASEPHLSTWSPLSSNRN